MEAATLSFHVPPFAKTTSEACRSQTFSSKRTAFCSGTRTKTEANPTHCWSSCHRMPAREWISQWWKIATPAIKNPSTCRTLGRTYILVFFPRATPGWVPQLFTCVLFDSLRLSPVLNFSEVVRNCEHTRLVCERYSLPSRRPPYSPPSSHPPVGTSSEQNPESVAQRIQPNVFFHFSRHATPKDSCQMASRWPSTIATPTRTAASCSSPITRKRRLLLTTAATWGTKVLALPWTGGELAGRCLHIALCPTTSSSWPSCTLEAAERTLPVTAGRRPGVPLSACAELSSQATRTTAAILLLSGCDFVQWSGIHEIKFKKISWWWFISGVEWVRRWLWSYFGILIRFKSVNWSPRVAFVLSVVTRLTVVAGGKRFWY